MTSRFGSLFMRISIRLTVYRLTNLVHIGITPMSEVNTLTVCVAH